MKKINYSNAIHEAGHAVMSKIVGRNLEYVTIMSKCDSILGECYNGDESPNTNESDSEKGMYMFKEALILLSGTAAESILLGTPPLETRGKDDFEKAEVIFNLPNDDLGKERCDQATAIVWDLFSKPLAKQQIKSVADALMEHKTLTDSQVVKIMKADELKK
jgi:ATP-dependent Zn protease